MAFVYTAEVAYCTEHVSNVFVRNGAQIMHTVHTNHFVKDSDGILNCILTSLYMYHVWCK